MEEEDLISIDVLVDFLELMQALSRAYREPNQSRDIISYGFKTSGFEKWFQFNFAGYLQNRYPEYNVMTESMPPVERSNYKYGNVDISISPKNSTGEFNTDFIELKCFTNFMRTENIGTWVDAFHDDIVKLNSLSGCRHNGSDNRIGERYAVAIAVYRDYNAENSLINNYQTKYGEIGMSARSVHMDFCVDGSQKFYFELLIHKSLPSWQ